MLYKNALVTATSDSFVLGTAVMLHTFRRHNPWFCGDIVVFAGDLSVKERELLHRIFPQIVFREMSSELEEAVVKMCGEFPHLQDRKGNFAIFDMFLLEEYERIFYVDSDVFFTASVWELFQQPQSFICCGDRFYYQGKARDRITHLPVEANVGNALHNNFNGGVLLIKNDHLGKKVFNDLLLLLTSKEVRENIKSQTRNQMILNLYFNDKCTIASAVYNYQLIFEKMSPTTEKVLLKDAVIIHFSGGNKPWKINRVLSLVAYGYAYGKAFQKWYEELFAILPEWHLQLSSFSRVE